MRPLSIIGMISFQAEVLLRMSAGIVAPRSLKRRLQTSGTVSLMIGNPINADMRHRLDA